MARQNTDQKGKSSQKKTNDNEKIGQDLKKFQDLTSNRESHYNAIDIHANPFESSNCMALFVTVTVFVVYMTTIHESLQGGDSGELIVAAYEFGVAHPPGYPTYTLLSQLFIYILPFGNIAWRVNLMTAMCGALAAGVFYILIYSMTKNIGAGLLGAGILAFSRLFWFWSMTAEVFSLNNLLLSLLMLMSVKLALSSKENKSKISLAGSFLCGLCLTNQHTSVLYIAFLVPWAFIHLMKYKLLPIRHLFLLSFAFALGLLPYLYLPLSSMLHQARWTWGDQSSFSGFLQHLLRKEYGTWDLLKDHEGQGFAAGLRAYLKHLTGDLMLPIILLYAFTPVTVIIRWKSNIGGVICTFFLMLVFYVNFFAWRANLDIKRPLFFKVVERFWMQADLVLIFMAALSFSHIIRFVDKTFGLRNLFVELLIVLPLISAQAYKWWPICNQSGNFVVEDFAVQSLNAFPNGSIILTKGDLPSNSFRYFHLCENVRPDLTVFDQEVLTYEWSLPMMRKFYPGIKFPGDLLHLQSGVMRDGRRSFTFKDLLDANIDSHPMFACIGVQDHEPSWQSAYVLWPFGICWKIVKQNTQLDIKDFTRSTKVFAEHWPYNWKESSANDGSWEEVANGEMWRAKTATAFFYLECAIPMEEGSPSSRKLLLESYKLFSSAIEKYPSFPSYWHRNYAITCEKLTRAKSSLKQVELLQKTVIHFTHFIKLNPDDADVTQIRKAIKSLQEYLASLK